MAKKKRNTKKSKNKAEKIDLVIISMIVVSILLAVFIYMKSGVIGEELSKLLGGIMGVSMYLLPIGMVILSLKLAIQGKEDLKIKVLKYIACIFSISVVFSIYQITSGSLDTTKTFNEIVNQAFDIGTKGQGGGAIGALAGYFLTNSFGNVGAIILGIGIAAVITVSLCGIRLSDLINQMYDYQQDKKEERAEERAKNKTVRIKEKEMKMEERAQRKSKVNVFDEEIVAPEQIKINYGAANFGDDETNVEPEIEMPKQPKLSRKHKTYEETVGELDFEINTGKEETEPQDDSLFTVEEPQSKKEDQKKEVLQLEHGLEVEDEHYEYPPIDLLMSVPKKASKSGSKAVTETANKLQKTLYSFGVSAKVENVSVGPAITRYELKPAEGVRVNKIANLADDIALNLAAETIRIEAPIPGKQAVGIEVPNLEKEMVPVREVVESDTFQNNESKLSIALGKDVSRKYTTCRYRKNASRINSRFDRFR